MNEIKLKSGLLLFCIFHFVGTSVNANEFNVGDVFYCTSEVGYFAESPDYQAKRWNVQKFKFKITQNKIKFGTGGYFNNDEMEIERAFGDLKAADSISIFHLTSDGRFNYATASMFSSGFMTGKCDKF